MFRYAPDSGKNKFTDIKLLIQNNLERAFGQNAFSPAVFTTPQNVVHYYYTSCANTVTDLKFKFQLHKGFSKQHSQDLGASLASFA